MLSIKSILEQQETGIATALRRSLSILLEGISLYAFPFGKAELSRFQTAIGVIRGRFERARSEDELLELSGAATRYLEDYSVAAERFETGQMKRLKDTVAVLTDSMIQLSGGSSESAQRLTKLRSELESVTRTDNLAVINTRLRSCLDHLCEEIQQQNIRQAQIVRSLDSLASLESDTPDTDLCTGLPGARAGIKAIREHMETGKAGRVLVFSVDRLEAVNLRYGFKVGDQLLLIFAQHLGQKLLPGETMFRWRGPCFVVLSSLAMSDAAAVAQAAKMASARLEYSLHNADRDITLRITGSWTVVPITAASSSDDILRKVDEFTIHRGNGTA